MYAAVANSLSISRHDRIKVSLCYGLYYTNYCPTSTHRAICAWQTSAYHVSNTPQLLLPAYREKKSARILPRNNKVSSCCSHPHNTPMYYAHREYPYAFHVNNTPLALLYLSIRGMDAYFSCIHEAITDRCYHNLHWYNLAWKSSQDWPLGWDHNLWEAAEC